MMCHGSPPWHTCFSPSQHEPVHSYLNTAVRIVELYKGDIPLAAWLKEFFRQHKQMGARDRRQVTGAVYAYYRLGQALPGLPVPEKILLGIFLCNQSPQELLQLFKPEWNTLTGLSLEEKLRHPAIKDVGFEPMQIFPWYGELSEGVDLSAFLSSFLQQPDVFLRIRPGHEQSVQKKMRDAGLRYEEHSSTCLALPASTGLGELLLLDQEAVVQDTPRSRPAGLSLPLVCLQHHRYGIAVLPAGASR